MRSSVLVASSVTPRLLLRSIIAVVSSPVAPRAAASVSSLTCSSVRPKLMVLLSPCTTVAQWPTSPMWCFGGSEGMALLHKRDDRRLGGRFGYRANGLLRRLAFQDVTDRIANPGRGAAEPRLRVEQRETQRAG